MLDLKRVLKSKPKGSSDEELRHLSTLWGERVARTADEEIPPRAEHPHPQFMRDDFQTMDGWWSCGFSSQEYDPLQDASEVCANATPPEDIDTPILVPFSPEADLSGVGRQLKPNELLWYRCEFYTPDLDVDERCLLHFEAVDDSCAVWVNGTLMGTHNGAYLPFSFDVTDELRDELNELLVCVADPSNTGIQLRGKQKLDRGDLWYTAQSGIWQPVWLEIVPWARIEGVRIIPDVDTATVHVDAQVNAPGTLTATISDGEREVQATAHAADGHAVADIAIPRPRLWSPDDPFLYDVELEFIAEDALEEAGEEAEGDLVHSYCAFRSVKVAADETGTMRFFLNGEPFFLKGVLDQGYWPESHMTASADEAFVFDIAQMKSCGFNMLRKHIKIESDRFYYHCDRLGMLVWQDMVSGGGTYDPMRTMYIPTLFAASWTRYSDRDPRHWERLASSNARYRELWTRTCEDAVRYLANHPCIVTWLLFNEGWGQFDARAAAEMVRAIDPARPIEAVSGWYDQGAGDFFGVHNYFRDQEVFRDKKGSCERPGERRACVTCEFGGLVFDVEGHTQLERAYGYDVYNDTARYRRALEDLLAQMDALEADGLVGYVYTQVSDVEEETNGILTYDRKVNKLDSQ